MAETLTRVLRVRKV